MANIRSQIKRNRQTEVRRRRNRATRSELRTRIKNANDAAEAGDGANEAAAAMQRLDKAAARRVIHRNTAARRKSRLQKRLNRLAQEIRTQASPRPWAACLCGALSGAR